MAVLENIKAAQRLANYPVLSSVFSAATVEAQSWQEVANEAAAYIADEWDWRSNRAIGTITGNGSTATWPVPANFRRLTRGGVMWSSRINDPLTFIDDINVWIENEVRNQNFVTGSFTRLADGFAFRPVLASGEVVTFPYNRSDFVRSGVGAAKAAIDADTDTIVFDDRLHKLAMVWLWRQSKRLDYAEDLQAYELLKAKLIEGERGTQKIGFGGHSDFRVANHRTWNGTVSP